MPTTTVQSEADPEHERGEKQAVALRPKSLAVLRYLMAHAGRVVRKEELLAACWPEVKVGTAALKVCIREIRIALGDNATTPQYIETIPRRGYRFIAPFTTPFHQRLESRVPRLVTEHHNMLLSQVRTLDLRRQTRDVPLVGRDAELAQLHGWLEQALSGQRQVVFVTGEAGIGKTALVDTFLDQIAADHRFSYARGQCEEQYGAGEAYLPVLQAVEHLCRAPENAAVIPLLRQHAPMWLVQLPTLLSPADREALPRELLGATRERMLREAAHAVEALTTKKGLVLVLEDLHWSDHSTVELLSFLARHRGAGRLLLIGTSRPEELLSREHPLYVTTHELQAHGQCQELALTWLPEPAMSAYLEQRFPGAPFPSDFVQLLHQRTEGNPLFMVNVADHLVERGVLGRQNGQWVLMQEQAASEIGLPATLRQVIEAQIARLPAPHQAMLEGASVAGMDFSTAAVAAGLGEAQEAVEQYCEHLARRGRFLRAKGLAEWPDGTAATQYEFLHALYQETFYERIAVGRRVTVHQRIGARLEAGYGEQTSTMAAELAMHFERGRDYRRAIQYFGQAAEKVIQRGAHQEASSLLTKGLTLLSTLPDAPERAQQELRLHLALGTSLMATKGYTAREVEHAYSRAGVLSRQLGDSQQLFRVIRD